MMGVATTYHIYEPRTLKTLTRIYSPTRSPYIVHFNYHCCTRPYEVEWLYTKLEFIIYNRLRKSDSRLMLSNNLKRQYSMRLQLKKMAPHCLRILRRLPRIWQELEESRASCIPVGTQRDHGCI